MRAIVVSRVYADPADQGKLKALAGLGVGVAAAVPDRWVPVGLGAEQQTSCGDDGGVRTVPIPVRGSTVPGGDPTWSRAPLRRLLTDFRPELIQIEEEPWTRAASTAAAAGPPSAYPLLRAHPRKPPGLPRRDGPAPPLPRPPPCRRPGRP